MEQVGQDGKPLADREIPLATDLKQTRIVSKPLPTDGQYRLAFYFGGRDADTEFWIDDVVLRSVQNEQTNIEKSKLTN